VSYLDIYEWKYPKHFLLYHLPLLHLRTIHMTNINEIKISFKKVIQLVDRCIYWKIPLYIYLVGRRSSSKYESLRESVSIDWNVNSWWNWNCFFGCNFGRSNKKKSKESQKESGVEGHVILLRRLMLFCECFSVSLNIWRNTNYLPPSYFWPVDFIII